MERITSKNNQLVKDIKKLFTSSKERKDKRLFVLEGARLCFDVLNSDFEIKYFLITESAFEKYKQEAGALASKSEAAFLISEEVSQKLSETQSSQGVFAVCKMREGSFSKSKKVIALDNVQDPANIGAVFRTAEALGIKDIILYNCCDIYNPKTLRASMGGVLRLQPIITENLEELLTALKDEYKIYSTVPSADAVKITEIDFSLPSVCVIGNEANGVEKNIIALSDEEITIPMLGRAESLNAGIAAAITIWEMLR